MHKSIHQLAEKALDVPGVCKATIYESLGVYAEEQEKLDLAKQQYTLAAMVTSCQTDHTQYEEHQKRITKKLSARSAIRYTYRGN